MRALVWTLALAGCGGGGLWPDVIPVREVSAAGGAPSVKRVRDLGNIEELPGEGALVPDSDGVFVVGEHVLVEGEDFGKLPTVLIGGRPATVLARTGGGGIVTRIPGGVLAGDVDVQVSHPEGKGKRSIAVHRYGLVAHGDGDALHVLDVGTKSVTATPTRISISNPRAIRFSEDGSIAYVASGTTTGAEPAGSGTLSVVAMGKGGGPSVVHHLGLDARFVVALATAEDARLLAVVGERDLQLFTLIDPRHPSPYSAVPLPEDVAKAGVVAADLDPGGKLLVILVAEGNRLVAFDVSQPASPKLAASLDILPEQRAPLVRDVRFSIDGSRLWVISGDNAMSIGSGKQPARITSVLATPGVDPVLAIDRTSTVTGATAPLRLGVARGTPLASGTTIRTPPEKAAVFVSAIDPRTFQLATLDYSKPEDRERAVALLEPVVEPGMVVRTDSEGAGAPLFVVPQVISSVDLSPDSQILVATACVVHAEGGADQLAIDFGVTWTPLWGSVAPTFVKLGGMQPGAFKPPFALGHVRIQP